MNGDHEYRSGKADGCRNGSLSGDEYEVLREPGDDYQPSSSAAHYCILQDVTTNSLPSPVRLLTSHSDCANTTVWKGRRSRNMTGCANSMIVIGPEKTDTDNETSDDGREKASSVCSQSDVDGTESTTRYSVLGEGHEDVDWSELSSTCAVPQSSDDRSSSCGDDNDDDTQSWTDDEEPELRDLLVGSSDECNNSDDYEKGTGYDEECDYQPQKALETNKFIVNENGAFEEVCLSSSTYYFHCSSKDDGRGSCL